MENDMDMDVSLVELGNKSLVLKKNPSVFYRCVIISFNVIFKLKSESLQFEGSGSDFSVVILKDDLTNQFAANHQICDIVRAGL